MKTWQWMGLAWILCLFALNANAANKVGTGDDGSDLEGFEKVTSGPLVESRDKAVELLKSVNTAGIPGLGQLLPEVERAGLYTAKKDVAPTLPEDEGQFHTSLTGTVYARTMPSPHAPVRFFPVTKGLGQDQLVSLHIHEGLHRSLPESIRENESIVSKITLAITGPEATHDQVRDTTLALLPEEDRAKLVAGSAPTAKPEVEHFTQPSSVGYIFRQFADSNLPSTYPVKQMHLLHSDLYFFGGTNFPIGLGLEMSWLKSERVSHAGPLGISLRSRTWSVRDFDVGLWASAAVSTLSSDELKNSPYGRDVLTLGVSLKKEMKRFYVENLLSVDFPGTSKQKVGLVTYSYEYGSVIDAKVKAGVRLGYFNLGAFGELHLADYFRVGGGAFKEDFGRFRVLSVGPEVTFATPDFSVGVLGRYLVDSTKNANFDYLGNLLGPGVAQGSLSAVGAVYF